MPNGLRDYASGFARAVSHKKWFIITGLAVGLGLIALSTYTKPAVVAIFAQGSHVPEITATALEHIGMGFVVAAIAVLFYEWSAHFKEFLQLSTQLTDLKNAIGEKALGDALRIYIRTGDVLHDRTIIAAVTQIVEGLKTLQDKGDWAQMGFQRFITTMLENVSTNTKRLVELSTRLRDDSANDNTYQVIVHTPAELVDTILAEQLRGLPPAGRYSVVTNPRDWQEGNFPKVLEQSKAAVARGVVVRRILVLAAEGANAYAGDSGEIERILSIHSAGDSYRLKVLDNHARKELKKTRKHAELVDEIFFGHFAIGDNLEAGHCLRIEAKEPGLSQFQLGGTVRGSRLMKCFDLVWETLPELDRARAGQIVERWPG